VVARSSAPGRSAHGSPAGSSSKAGWRRNGNQAAGPRSSSTTRRWPSQPATARARSAAGVTSTRGCAPSATAQRATRWTGSCTGSASTANDSAATPCPGRTGRVPLLRRRAPRCRTRRARPGSLRRQDLHRARRGRCLRRAGRFRHHHGARSTRRRERAERNRVCRVLARGAAGADAGPDASGREWSPALSRVHPDLRVRRPVAARSPAADPHDGRRQVGPKTTSSPPATSPRQSTARSCSSTRATGTCSPTTACPTTTNAPLRCSSDACSASSTTSNSSVWPRRRGAHHARQARHARFAVRRVRRGPTLRGERTMKTRLALVLILLLFAIAAAGTAHGSTGPPSSFPAQIAEHAGRARRRVRQPGEACEQSRSSESQ
jgi:hypothetical protein